MNPVLADGFWLRTLDVLIHSSTVRNSLAGIASAEARSNSLS